MTQWMSKVLVAGALLAMVGATSLLWAQEPAPDMVLSNGKIIAVDERFSIAQAVAVRGERIVAVGTNSEITRLAGPNTRRIDLRGRAVIPGLIDNHMHLLRAGMTWQWEVRWDGVGSRKEALDMLRARAKAVGRGEWVYNLGGWTIDQFSDDKRPFSREELQRFLDYADDQVERAVQAKRKGALASYTPPCPRSFMAGPAAHGDVQAGSG